MIKAHRRRLSRRADLALIVSLRRPSSAVSVGVIIALLALVGVSTAVLQESLIRQEEERTARFWSLVHVEGLRETYASMDDLVDAVDGIVTGRIESVGPGSESRDLDAEASGLDRSIASVYFVRMVVRVDESIAGAIPAGMTVEIEQIGDWDSIPNLDANKPSGRHLFFLVDKAIYDPALKGVYEPIRTIRDLRGKAAPVDPDEEFLRESSTASFDALLDSVRSAVGRP
jgi:hypothetical protein